MRSEITPWIGSEGIDISQYEGFVYIIQSNIDNKYYIGQKKFWLKRKLKPLKGYSRIRRSNIESDWKTYYGSSLELLEAIKKHGADKFTRKILYLCKSKIEMSYLETLEQFRHHVLFDSKSYNGIIHCRIAKNMIKNTEISKSFIKEKL